MEESSGLFYALLNTHEFQRDGRSLSHMHRPVLVVLSVVRTARTARGENAAVSASCVETIPHGQEHTLHENLLRFSPDVRVFLGACRAPILCTSPSHAVAQFD